MSNNILKNKIDFVMLVTVTNANPNGDPLNGNRPRETYQGFGEISDVCIKRKLRNRLQEMGESIFLQSDDHCDDGYMSLSERAANNEHLKKLTSEKSFSAQSYAEVACEEWIDVRSFGQVFAFKAKKSAKDEESETSGVSVGVRGPVSIQTAFSVSPISVTSSQITKSTNSEPTKGGKSSDTMGMRHRVDFGLYVVKGSINCQIAQKTGFTEDDAEKIREALLTLFENDMSTARPEGSMEVQRLYWWKHDCQTPNVSTAKLHRAVTITQENPDALPMSMDDYVIKLQNPEGAVEPVIYFTH